MCHVSDVTYTVVNPSWRNQSQSVAKLTSHGMTTNTNRAAATMANMTRRATGGTGGRGQMRPDRISKGMVMTYNMAQSPDLHQYLCDPPADVRTRLGVDDTKHRRSRERVLCLGSVASGHRDYRIAVIGLGRAAMRNVISSTLIGTLAIA